MNEHIAMAPSRIWKLLLQVRVLERKLHWFHGKFTSEGGNPSYVQKVSNDRFKLTVQNHLLLSVYIQN